MREKHLFSCRNKKASKSGRGAGYQHPFRWVLFEYKGLELVILSKPFKTEKLAEKARLNIPTASLRPDYWRGQ